MQSYSPNIAVPDQPFESLLLERVRPSYAKIDPSLQLLELLETLPDPIEVSPTDPAGIWVFGITDLVGRHEIDAGFEYFLKGVAVFTSVVKPECHRGVEAAVRLAGERLIQGKGLPEIDEALLPSFSLVLNTLFTHGEELVYRSFIAFATGLYWLLSYTVKRYTPHGTLTPLQWTERLACHWANLSYVPE